MATRMDKLFSVLDRNEEILAELASALTEEQSCIFDMDLERLSENSGRKESIMVRLIHVREECRAAMLQTGIELGLNEIPTLSVLIVAAAAAEQSKLRPVQRRLVWLAETLERQHAMNRRMLENTIGMIKSSMALFGRQLGGFDTYGAQGRINNCRTSGSFLRQEI